MLAPARVFVFFSILIVTPRERIRAGAGEQDSYGGKRVDMSTYKELYKKSNWNLNDKYKLPPLFLIINF
jgi:hypothetical protein